MTRARRELVSLDATPYYHCICRCVRRAFLCGEDHVTGRNYEHRKEWVLDRLHELQAVFTVDVCAYAIMSNHYHLVIRLNREAAAELTEAQVIERWGSLFAIPLLVQRYGQDLCESDAEIREAKKVIAQWRERLSDLSWYMRCLNEPIARRANEEDRCKGRFWEGRFKSQALLDEAAVLTCMSYVDLNPVRAGLADTPEGSDFTSIQQRIRDSGATKTTRTEANPIRLMKLARKIDDGHTNGFSFSTKDYLALVDWSGRAVRAGKRGAIPEHVPPILERLGIGPAEYLRHVGGDGSIHEGALFGHVDNIRQVASRLGRAFVKGVGPSRRLFLRPVI